MTVYLYTGKMPESIYNKNNSFDKPLYDAYKEGQQSILSQMQEVDLDKAFNDFLKYCTDITQSYDPIKKWLTFTQFIQQQNSSKNSNSSQEGKDGVHRTEKS